MQERDNLVGLHIDGKIITKWILRNRMRSCGLCSSGPGQEQTGSCKHCTEISD